MIVRVDEEGRKVTLSRQTNVFGRCGASCTRLLYRVSFASPFFSLPPSLTPRNRKGRIFRTRKARGKGHGVGGRRTPHFSADSVARKGKSSSVALLLFYLSENESWDGRWCGSGESKDDFHSPSRCFRGRDRDTQGRREPEMGRER